MKSIIRHGSTPPTSKDLDEYQLGFCNSNNLLYIKNANGEIVPLNDLQSIRNYIDESLGNGSSNKNEFVGTQEEWDALTAEEQNVYDIAYIKKSEIEASEAEAKGIPVGAVQGFALGTQSPNWLLCDGRDTTGTAEELRTHYPALYTYLGNSNVLPDYRECTLVGVGQNDTDTIAEHDVYTLGQFKDDQFQGHHHEWFPEKPEGRTDLSKGRNFAVDSGKNFFYYPDSVSAMSTVIGQACSDGTNGTPRFGTTTHGKQKGVAFYIKATSAGIEVDKDLYATKGYVNDAVSYSTTEQLTGGKWIDGKPIYRKAGIYNNGETIGTGKVLLDSTLTQSYIDTVIATGGSARGGADMLNLSIGGYSGDQYRLCIAIGNNGLIKLESHDTYTNFKWWIEYTKTTD